MIGRHSNVKRQQFASVREILPEGHLPETGVIEFSVTDIAQAQTAFDTLGHEPILGPRISWQLFELQLYFDALLRMDRGDYRHKNSS